MSPEIPYLKKNKNKNKNISTKKTGEMDSKENSSYIARGIRRLEKPEDFVWWLRELQATTLEEFWPLADPSSLAVPLLLPPRPLVQDLNPNAQSYLQLTASQRKIFDNAIRFWKDDQKEYRLQQAVLTEIKSKILETVPYHNRVGLGLNDSVKIWIQTLQAAMG